MTLAEVDGITKQQKYEDP